MIWLALACGIAGGSVLGWWAKGWYCERAHPSCPVWLQRVKRAWKAGLRRRYPEGRPERRTTQILTPQVLDKVRQEAAPLQRRTTPTAETDVGNKNRRT